MKLGPVEGIKSLKRNFEEYQRCVNMPSNTRATPSKVQEWYYAPALEKVGGSRFIGYEGMTCKRYNSEDIVLNGGDTQRYLQKWFDTLKKDDLRYSKAWNLAKALSKNDHVHASACFYVLKKCFDSEMKNC